MQSQSYFIRQYKPEDAESLHAAVRASMPELMRTMPWCHADYSLTDAIQWIEFTIEAWTARREYPLGIFDPTTGAVIGSVGVNQINTAHQFGNLGYWVSTPHTARGVARFAAKAAAKFGFAELSLQRLEIVTLASNLPSQRVAQAIGATKECIARNRIFFQDQAHDACVYSLIPSDARYWTLPNLKALASS
jgi:ribosomal-protein-serine acetyltransferase